MPVILMRATRVSLLVFVVALGLLAASCTPDPDETVASTASPVNTTAAVSNPSSPSTTFAPGIPNAEDYLLEAISFVESNALFAEEID
jgi:hypothetical protein